ncbi:Hypothetical predicted protein [Pelobates cultripes]|uniref:Mini-chromosome maintenance complex-binding protein n=1 Tax=Pelobates cultripes TaxID=61616 RepID=A0AAD1WUZ4_PELCU|nr:Hypothetical predicted protein [Pelobates cultripes]
MFDPEFYMGVFETIDPKTNSRSLHFGKYRDIADCPQQEVDVNSRKTVTSDRQTFYCIPIPGESTWAKEISFMVYETWNSFKVNDIIEVYGVLSVDPLLSTISDDWYIVHKINSSPPNRHEKSGYADMEANSDVQDLTRAKEEKLALQMERTLHLESNYLAAFPFP